MGASSWTKRTIKKGFRLLWLSGRPPLQRSPIHFPLPARVEEQSLLDSLVAEMLEKGAIEMVQNSRSPGFYSHLFTIPKTSGGFRPILDLSPLNTCLRKIKFEMDSPAAIRRSIQRGDWATSVDLKDAYFHIGINHLDRKWLRFTWRTNTFQYRVLPFGLSLSPWAFTKVVKDLIIFMRSQGVRMHAYLDDWLILASSKEECQLHTDLLTHRAASLGFILNQEKSDLTPSQQFTYLGMQFDTVNYTVQPSLARRESLLSQIQSLCLRRTSTARKIASALGKMVSMADLLPLGRLHKRPLQRALAQRFSQHSESWEKKIETRPWFQESCHQWTQLSWLHSSVPICPPEPIRTVFTDASNKGWGGHMGNHTASGTWSPDMAGNHINSLELEAVALTLQALSHFIPQGLILIRSDNNTVVALINNQGGTHAPRLSKRVEEILLWADSKGWSLSAKHVAGSQNIMADLLSRPDSIIQTEWTLDQALLSKIWKRWGTPQVDLFATRFNFRFPRYVSPVPDPQAWKVDAMEISWEGLDAYAFPPFSLIHLVLEKARREKPSLVLITPLWKTKPWFPTLMKSAHQHPMDLQVENHHLTQPRSGITHSNAKTLNLHAWRLCGSTCSAANCLKTL